jgi:transposase
MGNLECPGCRARELRIAELERRNAELEQRVSSLEARLGNNSSNSSIPPSANPLDAPKPVRKPKSKRRPGAQPGHPPHLKRLLPPERINHVERYVPQQCERCQAELSAEPAAHDPEPTRFQTLELPPVVAQVTEHQGHARTCSCCGHITWATIPESVRAHSVGARLTATLSYLAGYHGLSQRNLEDIADVVLDAPVALGTVGNLEQEVSQALQPAHEEALGAVRAAAVKNADETSWKRAGALHWLWAAATTTVAAFVIHAKRSALGLTALLGSEIQGILCSDRWSVYNRVPVASRQICWAHLKRDFQKIVDGQGPSAGVGRAGLKIVKKVFAAWHAFQEGEVTRAQLETQLEPIEVRLNRILLEGALLGDDAKVARFCENVLALEPALWTFAHREGVEPTNNAIERLLRRAVLWRKRSFGSWSAAGCRFVERILTVVQTRRLQQRAVLEYLHDAVLAYRTGQPCPSLLSAS